VQEVTAAAQENARAINAAQLFELDDVIDPAETGGLIAATLTAAGTPEPSGRRSTPGDRLLAARACVRLTRFPSGARRTLERMFPDAPDDRDLPLESLEDQISELAGHLNAGMARWLELVGEFDRRQGHLDRGCLSCASWLSWRCGISPRAARDQVRVAAALPSLPATRSAFARGELSYSKVRALVRIATPESEAELAELALHTTAAQLERLVTATSGCLSREDAQHQHARRHLSWEWDEDGALCFRGRLPAEEGALLLAALDATRADLGVEGGSAEPSAASPRSASNADCLVTMASGSLASQRGAVSGGDLQQLVVHVDADGLRDGTEPGQIHDGPRISPATVRRLACDAAVVSVVESDGQPLSVGRRTRTVPPALRRALRARDPGCRFPGCTNHRFVDAHHVQHWADGGDTSLENLVHLCRRHHRLLHEGDIAVERDGEGDFSFTLPGGRPVPEVGPVAAGEAEAVREVNERRSLAIGPDTAGARSYGDRWDFELAVEGVVRRVRPLAV
jgi:hypothetical protein